ncbi:AraC family transcriptional regulator [Vineibacter terrae]|uniref:AraC family transcriptional regulator n=1 Tax=Vineibacter terrae TaxID=2586908 RepID=UPI001C498443|nr:AraC family transcriptional regulator [Vineibacter terrae]
MILDEMGKEAAAVIARAGINPDVLRNPENFLSFTEVGRLLQACVTATDCQHFGFLVGRRSTTASLGLVGRLMRNAPTLGQAIRDICVNQKYYVQGAVTYLALQGETAFWGYAVYFQGMQAREQLVDGATAVGVSMFRELSGVSPDAVLSLRQPPRDVEPYRQFYGYVPQFGAEQNAIVFPARLLAAPVQGADRQLRRILEASVAKYWAAKKPSVSEQAIRLLRAAIIFDRASLEEVAGDLGMQARTVNRRLKEEGTTFRDLLNKARFDVAREMLMGTRMPVTDVALAMGYADASTFNHAFQRWAGMAPSEWRGHPEVKQL